MSRLTRVREIKIVIVSHERNTSNVKIVHYYYCCCCLKYIFSFLKYILYIEISIILKRRGLTEINAKASHHLAHGLRPRGAQERGKEGLGQFLASIETSAALASPVETHLPL